MPTARSLLAFAALGALAGCGDNAEPPNFPIAHCEQVTGGHCIEIHGGDSSALQTAVNSIDSSTTIVLGLGTFQMTNQLTIRSKGAHLLGQGIDLTTL